MNTDSNSPHPEISALRNQMFTLLIALIVVSGTLTVYLYRQASILGKELNASEQLINRVNNSHEAVMTFANQLGAYSMTHEQIRPVLAKYGIVPAPTQPVPKAPSATSAAEPKK